MRSVFWAPLPELFSFIIFVSLYSIPTSLSDSFILKTWSFPLQVLIRFATCYILKKELVRRSSRFAFICLTIIATVNFSSVIRQALRPAFRYSAFAFLLFSYSPVLTDFNRLITLLVFRIFTNFVPPFRECKGIKPFRISKLNLKIFSASFWSPVTHFRSLPLTGFVAAFCFYSTFNHLTF